MAYDITPADEGIMAAALDKAEIEGYNRDGCVFYVAKALIDHCGFKINHAAAYRAAEAFLKYNPEK